MERADWAAENWSARPNFFIIMSRGLAECNRCVSVAMCHHWVKGTLPGQASLNAMATLGHRDLLTDDDPARPNFLPQMVRQLENSPGDPGAERKLSGAGVERGA